ncbi:MAG TPA: glycosyltransferase family 4 protein [Verrucomicrobiae bacterium]|nr:glycosyltransferase family 4 protein [Verrucomicrobiae bacterium]
MHSVVSRDVGKRLRIAWISAFPVEWLSEVPSDLANLPRQHPLSWMRVLEGELENSAEVELHVLILRKQFPRSMSFTRNGVHFHLIRTPGSMRAPSLFWMDTLLIRRKMAEISPDLVHAWGTEMGASVVAHRLKYPYLVTVQGLLTWYNEVTRLDPYHRFMVRFERRYLPRAPLVTTESAFAVRFLKHKWPALNIRQVEHAPDWVFHQVSRTPEKATPRFLFVGTVNHLKGGDLLLKGLDILSAEYPFTVAVLGKVDKESEKSICSQMSQKLRERIQFRHDLAPSDVAAELACATMMLFPTRGDTSPNAVKEAAVSGLPVVGSRVGGIPDYIIDGENGILFDSNDLQGFVAAIKKAAIHPLFRNGTVDPARLAKVRDYLSPKRMAKSFVAAYFSTVKNGHHGSHNIEADFRASA